MASDGSQAFVAPDVGTSALGYLPGMASMRERRSDPWNGSAAVREKSGGGSAAGSVRGNVGTWYGPAPVGSAAFRARAAEEERATQSVADKLGVVGKGSVGVAAAPRPKVLAEDLPVRGAAFRLPVRGCLLDDSNALARLQEKGALTFMGGDSTKTTAGSTWHACSSVAKDASGIVVPAGPCVLDSCIVSDAKSMKNVLAMRVQVKAVFVSVHVGSDTTLSSLDALVAEFAAVTATIESSSSSSSSCAVGIYVCDTTGVDAEVLHTLVFRLISGSEAPVVPSMLCLPVNPRRSQRKIIGLCYRKGVTVIAVDPLGVKTRDFGTLQETQVLRQLCERYGKSIEAVLLRWCAQRGVAFLLDAPTEALLHAQESLSDDDADAPHIGVVRALKAAEHDVFTWDMHPKDKALIDALAQ